MRDWTAEDRREAYEERAAIREYCGGYSRAEAETLARDEIRHLVGRNHPETSRQAAQSISGDLDVMREAVRNAIRLAGDAGMTCDEIEVKLNLSHQTVSARCSELHHKFRVIEPSGEKRPTRRGRPAQVYVIRADQPKQLDLVAGGDTRHY